MRTISQTLDDFLGETGGGNSGSAASPITMIRIFREYLNGWAHEDLSTFERERFEDEYSDTRRFCDIFDATRIKPHHLNAMLGHHALRHGPSTKGFLRAVGPTMERLAAWLVDKGIWTEDDHRWFRELVGDKPGRELVKCEELARCLFKYANNRPVDPPDELPDDDYLDDEFTIAKVEPGALHVGGWGEGDETIVLKLPKAVTSKAKVGWSVSLELGRVRGKWRILGVGGVNP